MSRIETSVNALIVSKIDVRREREFFARDSLEKYCRRWPRDDR